MKKNILGLIFTLIMMITMIPATVCAGTKSYNCNDNLTYILNDEGTFTVSGTGPMEAFSYDTLRPWHGDRNSIKKIVIDPGVTTIGSCAFQGCENLTEVSIPEGVTTIGNLAFDFCNNLQSVTIPASVSQLGDAFTWCNKLDSITIKRNEETSLTFVRDAFDPDHQATIEWTGEELPEGFCIEYSVDPEDAGYSVSGNILSIAGNQSGIVRLITTKKLKEYEVVFVNDDSTVLQSGKCTHGEMPSYDGEEPIKPSTAQYSYEFAGWTPEIVEATGDATYTATYTGKLREYDLTFDLGGGTLDGKTGAITMTCKYGDTIKLPDAPTKEGYKFLYWKGSQYDAGASYTVKGAHTFTAEWESVDNGPKKDSDNKKTPTTGDNSPIGTYIAIMIGSLLLLTAGVVIRKRAE